jgi:hypothetical protein
MSGNSGGAGKRVTDRHESHFGEDAGPAESLAFSQVTPGQIDPRHCPYRDESAKLLHGSPLGEPLTIDDVAVLLGCSAWTVRQKYLPQGLPHLRVSSAGKFTFFREQVINWILKRQGKGGTK